MDNVPSQEKEIICWVYQVQNCTAMERGQEIRKARKRISVVAAMKFGRMSAAQFPINAIESGGMGTRDGFALNTQSSIPLIISQEKAYNNCFNLTLQVKQMLDGLCAIGVIRGRT
jgi:hypothetical protein